MKLSEEVHEWSYKNFGEQHASRQITGIGEELGELAGSLLNENQSRERLSEQSEIVDAVADAGIYAMDLVGNMGLDLKPHLYPVPVGPPEVFWHLKMQWEYGKICHIHLKHEQGIRQGSFDGLPREALIVQKMSEAAVDLLATFTGFLHARNVVFDDALKSTWLNVSKRDWQQFPNNGRTK
jgi:NTP pyrophosphatase (non-canonical NTP hydrolase)